MKRASLLIYVIITSLITFRALADGQDLINYFDFTSLSLVIAPSTLVFLITRKKNNCVKYVMLTSILAGTFGLILGTILTFSGDHFEPEGTLMGLSIALLPILYASLLSLLICPFHFISTEK